MLWASSLDWETGTFAGTATSNNALALAQGQTSGTWTSAVVDFGGAPSSWSIAFSITGLSSGYSYETRSSADGTTWTAYSGGLIEPPARYGQIQITLTSSTTTVASLNWGAVVESTRPTQDLFRRILDNNFRLGIDTGPQSAPCLSLIPPVGADTVAQVGNDRLTISGQSPAVAVSFDLTANTLGNLLTILKANLPSYTVTLLPAPPGWPGSDLSSISSTVLAPTPPQPLAIDPVLGLWQSRLWRILKPIGMQLATLAAQATGLGSYASLTRARGYWLDRWGDYTGLPRYPGEPDSLYRSRMLALRFRPNTELGLQDLLGYTVTTTGPGQYEILIPVSLTTFGNQFAYSGAQIQNIVDEQNPVGFVPTIDWSLTMQPQVLVSTLSTQVTQVATAAVTGWGGAITYGYSASDWTNATLSSTDAATRPGSVILASTSGTYDTSGTATTPALEFGVSATQSGNTITPSWYAFTPTGTTVSVSARFSSDGITWGSYEALTSGTAVAAAGRYVQVQVTLSTTSTAVTPQFNNLQLLLTTSSDWGAGQWVRSGYILTLMPVIEVY